MVHNWSIFDSFAPPDASFSESLYGLRRRAVNIKMRKGNNRSEAGDRIHQSGLEKHQKVLSVVFLVGFVLLLETPDYRRILIWVIIDLVLVMLCLMLIQRFIIS